MISLMLLVKKWIDVLNGFGENVCNVVSVLLILNEMAIQRLKNDISQ